VIAILGFSAWGATRGSGPGAEPMGAIKSSRLIHYALTGTIELLVVAWVALGLRLRRVSFRTLFGAVPRGLNAILTESAFAFVFWIASLVVLAAVGLGWNLYQTHTYHQEVQKSQQQQGSARPAPKPESPQQQKLKIIRNLMELAPGNIVEVLAWGLLCLLVGFSEELIFRGYLQAQGIALLRRLPLGIAFSALIFGAAHGYEGTGAMIQIAVYGALFSVLTVLRRGLFPGMLAHAWHDFATGMFLALMRETHMLDRIPLPS
jgi:membrane protease YdiL (CAAX protease family)